MVCLNHTCPLVDCGHVCHYMILIESYIHYITKDSVERYSGIRTERMRPAQQSTKVRTIRKVIGVGKNKKNRARENDRKKISAKRNPKRKKSCGRRVAFLPSNWSNYNSAKLQIKVLKTVVLLTNFPVFCHRILFI